MKSIKKYFESVYSELKKVSWPSRTIIINHTIIVLVSSVVAMGIVAAIDYGLAGAVKYYISLK